jgi:hypothetical protein
MNKMTIKLFRKGHSSQVHIIIGMIVLFVLNYLNKRHSFMKIPELSFLDYAIIIFIVFAYSQMPDIDQPGSRIARALMITGLSVIGYAFIQGEKKIGMMATAILLFTKLTTHRTMIHSAGVGLLFSLPLYFIKPIYGYIAFISFLAHIISEGEFSLYSGDNWRIFK